MDLVQKFTEQAKTNPLKIVFPEGDDERVVEAAVKVKQAGICKPILLEPTVGVAAAIAAKKGLSLEGIPVICPENSDRLAAYAQVYIDKAKAEGRTIKENVAAKIVKKILEFSCLMVKTGDADGMVGGVANETAKVISAAATMVGYEPGMATASSFFMMILPEFLGEADKVLIFADCAVNPNPNPKQLAEIGIASGINAKNLLGMEPKIAFLSFSTKGSAQHADITKVTDALAIAQQINKEKNLGFEIDGEMQGDAAIMPKVGAKKAPGSKVAGTANVLVFPDLDAGNIGYKLTERLAKAKALGPILQGFAKPVNDMSRGASVDDLVGVAAITVVQAQGAKK